MPPKVALELDLGWPEGQRLPRLGRELQAAGRVVHFVRLLPDLDLGWPGGQRLPRLGRELQSAGQVVRFVGLLRNRSDLLPEMRESPALRPGMVLALQKDRSLHHEQPCPHLIGLRF